MYGCVERGLGCPIQRAMVTGSTPAWSRAMAAECRRVCGVTCLSRMDGQPAAAVAACRWTRSWTASEDGRRPGLVGNSGSPGLPGCSRSQVRITAATFAVSGVTRSLRPLPWQRTLFPPVRVRVLRQHRPCDSRLHGHGRQPGVVEVAGEAVQQPPVLLHLEPIARRERPDGTRRQPGQGIPAACGQRVQEPPCGRRIEDDGLRPQPALAGQVARRTRPPGPPVSSPGSAGSGHGAAPAPRRKDSSGARPRVPRNRARPRERRSCLNADALSSVRQAGRVQPVQVEPPADVREQVQVEHL